MVKRHHTTKHQLSESESDSEDDVFASLSSKSKKKNSKKKKANPFSKGSSSSSNIGIKLPSQTTASASKLKASDTTIVSTSSSITTPAKSNNEKKTPVITIKTPNNNTHSSSSNTTSAKRHHHTSNDRKNKMDALLDELQYEAEEHASMLPLIRQQQQQQQPKLNNPRNSISTPTENCKKGSFVEEGEELSTTNIFVANLAPSVTEEALTDLFRQFGSLHSVKIMWPRTDEEKARNRNTGFVCYLNREDAEDAMDNVNYTDPFANGRRIVLRWGKNVKKIVKRGTGGIISAAETDSSKIRPRSSDAGDADYYYDEYSFPGDQSSKETHDIEDFVSSIMAPIPIEEYDAKKHNETCIKVHTPQKPHRAAFITKFASYVAKDGSMLEHYIIEKERNNPEFSFLFPQRDSKDNVRERIFYRWRVYAFAQGDGFHYWHSEPFQMIYPNGAFWIPPPIINTQKAIQEKNEILMKYQKDIKRNHRPKEDNEENKISKPSASISSNNNIKLNNWEKEQFNQLFYQQLTISRSSICQAMAFCFDKSAAAIEISAYLKESFISPSEYDLKLKTEKLPSLNQLVNKLIARLYLLSDVLFNSQQPGVRHAFKFREQIYEMAPSVFQILGLWKNKFGRITWNKLYQAVVDVLDAWGDWSVYNAGYLKELKDMFQFGEVKKDNLQHDHEKTDIKEEYEVNNLDGEVLEKDDLDKYDEKDNLDYIEQTTLGESSSDAKITHLKPQNNWEVIDETKNSTAHLIDKELDGEPLDDDDILVLEHEDKKTDD